MNRRCRLARTSVVGLAVATVMACIPAAVEAFRQDVHFQTTFAMALAAGWSWRDSGVIASADYALDENEETTAALEFTASKLLIHQSTKNYDFHCFSRSDDKSDSEKHQVSQDVLGRIKVLRDKAVKAVTAARASKTAQDRTTALIAIGVLAHCQQDSWSHSGYGGNRLGHTWADVVGHSPDRAAQRVPNGELALKDAQALLQDFFFQLEGTRPPAFDSPQLRAAVNDKRTLTSDSALFRLLPSPFPAEVSPDPCVAGLARHWSYVTLFKQARFSTIPSAAIVAFLPAQFSYCTPLFVTYFNLKPDREALMIIEAPPQYPKFDGAATPTVNSDGSYATVGGSATFDQAIVNASGTATVLGGGCRYDLVADVTNLGPGPAPNAQVVAAIVGSDETSLGGGSVNIGPRAANGSAPARIPITSEKDCSSTTAFVIEVQPPAAEAGQPWNDRSASNNRVQGLVKHAVPVG